MPGEPKEDVAAPTPEELAALGGAQPATNAPGPTAASLAADMRKLGNALADFAARLPALRRSTEEIAQYLEGLDA